MARGGVIGKQQRSALDWPRKEPPLRLILALLTALAASPAMTAERPVAGLMWNRSGLPATLPLQLHSEAGLDHVVMLTPPGGDAPVLAAYIRGGDFFRVLVPPGDWQIGIASGADWQGGEALFGAATQWTSLPEPLHFGVSDGSRREGHVLWLGQEGDQVAITETAPQTICELAGLSSQTRDLRDDSAPDWSRDVTEGRPAVRKLPSEPRVSTQALSFDRLPAPQVQRPPLTYQSRELRLRRVFCD
ncbi:hypothetical protein [uncultured Paracoccus sp.]|uniref:hypothetical protein n=1 Tax=uncultured Paracoccus sp. TaxID=189685 RepID=UPI00260EF941|nr:hypothetical protein [uncultured Paracoccus sp.]